MTRIIAFAIRPDEMDAFKNIEQELDLEILYVKESLSLDNVHLTKGYELVSFLGNCDLSEPVLKVLKGNGVKYLASRSAGYNNVDMKAAAALELRVSNATYSPNCVADYAVMLILMAVRKMKFIMNRTNIHDYSLAGIQGKEMHNLTFGVLGTGRIGATTARNLSGFGGKILAYDVYQNESIKDIVTYVDFETFMKECDVITLHAPLLDSTHHIINKESLELAKEGVVIVNCARGELVDTQALIEALESGKISACGLDVVEGELGIFHNDWSKKVMTNKDIAVLQRHQNVIVSPHAAFYTNQAVKDMVEVAMKSLVSFNENGTSPWEVR